MIKRVFEPPGVTDVDHSDQKLQHERPDSPGPGPGPGPGPSCVSMKSEQSEPQPVDFMIQHDASPRIQHKRPDSPGPSCVSMKSDRSMPRLIDFKDGGHYDSLKVQHERPDSPGPTSVSIKSDSSMPIDLKDGRHSDNPRIHQERPDFPGPGPSCLSMKRDRSMPRLIDFKNRHHSDIPKEVPNSQSPQQHQTDLDSIFMLLEENIVTFVKSELKKIQTVLTSDYSECLESQGEDEEVLDGEDEEQRRSSREAFLNIALHFLRSMKQEELADRLHSSKRVQHIEHDGEEMEERWEEFHFMERYHGNQCIQTITNYY